MKITPKENVTKVTKHQDGGQIAPNSVPMNAPQAAPSGKEDPLVQLLQVAAQAVQTQNCEAAMAVCTALIEMASQNAGPQQSQGEPVYKNGGKIVRRIKTN
jgi:hypothetical protein